MEYFTDPSFLIYFAISFITGGFLGRTLLKPKASARSSDKSKLEKEVLSDQVKQLEAKIQTLEKALELSQKS